MRHYCGKLLLLGEYTVVLGAKALVLPYCKFTGHWAFASELADQAKAAQNNASLRRYVQWLSNQQIAKNIDLEQLTKDVERGLVFDSDIPHGYGLGSSGALVAAIFERYGFAVAQMPLPEMRMLLAGLENFFHGSSSGLDPLACFIGKPLLVDDKDIRLLEQCPGPLDIGFSLLDTGITSPTGPLVEYFRTQLESYSFFKKLDRELIPATEKAIQAWIEQKGDVFMESLHKISAFQLRYFQPMIPEFLRPKWHETLAQGKRLMKLCGSGGGGYVLVFEVEKAKKN